MWYWYPLTISGKESQWTYFPKLWTSPLIHVAPSGADPVKQMWDLFCKLWVFVWVITSKRAEWSRKCAHIPENHLGYGKCQRIHWQWNSSRKCCLVAELRLGSFNFCLGGDLLIFANYILLCVNSILVITWYYVKQSFQTLPDKETFWADYSLVASLLIRKGYCLSTGMLMRALLSLIPTAYQGTVEWLTVKVSLMYISLIRFPREKWISLVTLLHIFTLQ